MHDALFREGVREIIICKDALHLRTALNQEIIDLLICDVTLPGLNLPQLMQDVRQRRIGRNPFMAVMAMLPEASLEDVREFEIAVSMTSFVSPPR